MSSYARRVDEDNPAIRALAESGIAHEVTRHGRVGSLAEAAAARGVEPSAIVKTMVVRRGEGDHLFVLVPGDREISWPKLRSLGSILTDNATTHRPGAAEHAARARPFAEAERAAASAYRNQEIPSADVQQEIRESRPGVDDQ